MSLTKCDICKKSSASDGSDNLFFGDWMSCKNITCHYYCLLLSTHLPQRGKDNSGILGFQINDIRKEIVNAKKRQCKYCKENSATIMCATCKEYFHLTCGHTNICLFEFINEFKSYCHECIPPDDDLIRIIKKNYPNEMEIRCYICMLAMGQHKNRIRWIYSKCCEAGFAHSKCVKKYALCAGYYLTCIWCKNKRFREDIKYQGVFVPDRDANWETEQGAYQDLHRSHRRCDMEICHCPKGRYYINANKWQVIMCKMCGAFGAHNPSCIPGFEHSKSGLEYFTCDTCSVTEHTLNMNENTMADGISDDAHNDVINTSLYLRKKDTGFTQNHAEEACISFSDDSETSSVETVVNLNILNNALIPITPQCIIPVLTQCETQSSMEIENASQDKNKIKETNVDSYAALEDDKNKIINVTDKLTEHERIGEDIVMVRSESSENEENLILDRLVRRMLDLFE